jgi:hypothetical protein
MKLIPVLMLLCSVVVFSRCSEEKISEDELLASLKTVGCTVIKEGRIHPSLEGALRALWLNIDGKRISAYQFSTTAKAKLKVRTFQNGLQIGFWVFEYVDGRTAEKIKRALK